MSNADHTPGIWFVAPDTPSAVFTVRPDGVVEIVCQSYMQPPVDKANSHLISAAPDMLVALKHCREMLMRHEINHLDGDDISDVALRKIKAAIIKAEGGAA